MSTQILASQLPSQHMGTGQHIIEKMSQRKNSEVFPSEGKMPSGVLSCSDVKFLTPPCSPQQQRLKTKTTFSPPLSPRLVARHTTTLVSEEMAKYKWKCLRKKLRPTGKMSYSFIYKHSHHNHLRLCSFFFVSLALEAQIYGVMVKIKH